jgi:hypothetical protein
MPLLHIRPAFALQSLLVVQLSPTAPLPLAARVVDRHA